jgi:hypothetical protein
MNLSRRLFVISIMLLRLSHAAPGWMKELTPANPGSFPKIPPSVLEFQISWNGTIQAGHAKVEFSPVDVKRTGTYIVRSAARSQGTAALLFPYQTNFWSELNPETLRPRLFHALETDDTEKIDTTVRYFPNRVEFHETNKTLKTGKNQITDRTAPLSPVFDIFSAMLHVRSQKLDAGDTISLLVQPFGSTYFLRVKVDGREIHNGQKTIRLNVGMRKIDRKTLELLPYKKLKKDAVLWLSDDADRVPVELRAAVFIGDIRAKLSSHLKP